MGFGTAWGGRLPCKQEIQVGSIPTRSMERLFKMCSILDSNNLNHRFVRNALRTDSNG